MSEDYAVEMQEVVKRFGTVTAVDRVSLKIKDGEFFSLLGPSGCGKTTTLRLIAGFEIPTNGLIYIGGEMQGYLPAYQRPVNTVFQHYALFPHMTVSQNIAFGLEMQKVTRPEIKTRVTEALEMVHLTGMGNRRPKQLSGGQQQRVALARALVNRPKVLLLDEPLGALDLKLRKAMQVELKDLQTRVGITFIYVTHDQEEALTMSDRIAVMNRGKLLQVGSPQEVYETPQTRFVSDFIGETNYLDGTIVEFNNDRAKIVIQPDVHIWTRYGPDTTKGQQVSVAFRPEKIDLYPGEVDAGVFSGDHNRLKGKVQTVVYTGSTTTYYIDLTGSRTIFLRQQNADATLSPHLSNGDPVTVSWPIEASMAFTD